MSLFNAEINISLLASICDIIAKIDRWWIREVELTTDPDYDGREVADDDIISGNMICLQLMLRIATGEDSGAYLEEFQKQTGCASV